jgi:small-conductance mechanosensitive channel
MTAAAVWDLLVDNSSAGGKAITSTLLVLAGWLLAAVLGRFLGVRRADPFDRYVTRKLVRYAILVVVAVALAVLWRPFAGRLGVVLGFVTAGVAFAMQEVIGAFAGWISIFSGGLYRVGDRVEVGGVRGDVIDISPLRTKLMEMGSPRETASWVGGRQFTGRVVSVSNKSVFTAAVFNYSASFDFLWEEMVVPIPYDADWHRAEEIVGETVRSASSGRDAREAIARMRRSYPVPATELEPRVFVRLTDNWVELAARFVVPVRTARSTKDEISRHLLARLTEAGIEVASDTTTVTLQEAGSLERSGREPGDREVRDPDVGDRDVGDREVSDRTRRDRSRSGDGAADIGSGATPDSPRWQSRRSPSGPPSRVGDR